MIHIYTGDGKGKTTAAMGLAARAAGYSGGYVLVTQFMKCGREGEAKSLAKIGNITFLNNSFEHGFVFAMNEAERAKLTAEHNKTLAYARACAEGGHVKLIVLDELISAYTENVIDRGAVDALLTAGYACELVLTGRNVPEHMLELADYVTEMKLVKHPYVTDQTPARQGIEY